MKAKDIILKYHLHYPNFIAFLEEGNLEYTKGFFDDKVDDAHVEEYVKMFKESKYYTPPVQTEHINKDNIADTCENKNPGLEAPINGALYSIRGVRGRHIDVFENKCIINTKVTIGSILTHNATDGTKTIYYADVVGVQFKEPGITIGFLQLETPGLTMNNAASNFFNENSFTFDTSVISTEKMREIAAYIEQRVYDIKHPSQQETPMAPQISVADELLKFKQLLDMGALTQEEFDAKKKELLSL